MCGICGTVGFADAGRLAAMTEAMCHRGPDDGGVAIFPGADGAPIVGLGNRRLAIIDLSPAGHQPMSNEDGTVWLTYNGELYNFLDLRPGLEARGHRFKSHTDSEVLIHLYEERGDAFLDDLNGMFGLALWDDRKNRLLLARDQFGIKPLYYLPLSDGRLAFASEIKCFLAAGLLTPKVDLEALHYYLNFLWVPGPKTLFDGVFKLMPGELLAWQDGRWSVRTYWRGLPESTNGHRSEVELADELRERLFDAVKRQLVSDVPLGVFLSGGLDSSALLALATKIGNRSMSAYTIAYRSDDARFEQSDEDRRYARIVAGAFDADHHEIEIAPDIVNLLPTVVWHLDEPVADPAAITSYLICKAARRELTVLLSGQGGDEVFGGYRVHLTDRLSRPLAWLPGLVRDRALMPLWDVLPAIQERVPGVRPGKLLAYHRYIRKLMRGAAYGPAERFVFHRSYYEPGEQAQIYTKDLAAQVAAFDPYETHLRFFEEAAGADFLDQTLFVDQKTFLPELNLTYSDKTSMAASVEVRVPLLDRQVADFMRGLPPSTKVRGLRQKHLFKKAMAGILPDSVINRGKAGFGAPIRSWLRAGSTGLIDDLLAPETVRRRGYLDAAVVSQMVAEHQAGQRDHTYRLWTFLTLELWLRIFVDRAGQDFLEQTK